MNEALLTFLPFLKRQPALRFEGGESGQLSAPLSLAVIDKDGVKHQVKSSNITLRGPGDVLGISQSMIARLEPPPQTHDFEPNYFPYIEFVDSDFCWRYSLDTLSNNSRTAEPWLTLIVLSSSEMDAMTNEGVEVLSLFEDRRELLAVYGQYLPSLQDAKLTAHVQLNNQQSPIADYIENQPSSHFCRLFSFRRLVPETSYTAFLVPTYKIGVQAAFGLDQQDAGDAKAWESPDADQIIKLPVYFSWSFSTSESGDFEKLARSLMPSAISSEDGVGTRVVDAKLIKGAITESEPQPYFLREGALAAPGFSEQRKRYSESLPMPEAFLTTLNQSLKSSQDATVENDVVDDPDPLITLPVYGRFFHETNQVMPPNEDQWPGPTAWVHELNMDFRHRVAASFGTASVQSNQDEYMRVCWGQVDEIRKANEKIRLTKAAYILSKAIQKKHLEPLSAERFALISTPFHAHFSSKAQKSSVSIKQEFAESGISPGVYSGVFRRVANRQIGIRQVMPVEAIKKQITTAVHPRELNKREFRFHNAPKVLSDSLSKKFGTDTKYSNPKKAVIPVKLVEISNLFRASFDIEKALKNKILGSVQTRGDIDIPENFDPIMAYPKINTAMYGALKNQSSDYLLPGIENIANNGVTLCEENRRFIEAYMVGLNHEMGRELVWRNYPTDQRGTVFSYFWDQVESNNPPTDIKDIHKWANNLGSNKYGLGTKNIVLLIKGDIIRRYPGTIVYVVKISGKGEYWSKNYPEGSPPMDQPYKIDPILRAQVGTDILCVGFPLSLDSIHGKDRDGEYYFILQENQDLPRFGLDVASKRINNSQGCGGEGSEIDINDLSWSDMNFDDAGYLNRFEESPLSSSNTGAVTSATIATETYQLPIRVSIHVSELLEDSETL